MIFLRNVLDNTGFTMASFFVGKMKRFCQVIIKNIS